MLFPELSRKNRYGLGPTTCFFRGLLRRPARMNGEKIFMVGFHKTGTTSLARALQILGYRVCGFVAPDRDIDPSMHSSDELFERAYKPLLHAYDAFEDTLWFIYYKKLAKMYPDAKFILTVRPEESWYKSMVRHFGGYDRKIFHWIYDGYGDPSGNRTTFIDTYVRHNREVMDYFGAGNTNFLVMHMPRDFNWQTLCGFLDHKEPFGSFPHANTASSRETIRRKIIDRMKSWYYRYNQA